MKVRKNLQYITICLSFLMAGLFFGCFPYAQPFNTTKATLGIKSAAHKDLTGLPAPKEKIVAAVYKFRDQTGQYKATETGTSWSTAVTQGATSILLRALEESGWFMAIEREGLSNLLNERKIIRSSRAEFLGNSTEQKPLLPPLLFAGIILEGGIISYDTNILTGGAGLKYFGLGASGQYREDRVTIYIRAISTQNGRILKTVYTTKTILSQVVDVNLYRYVKFKRLLEAEVGYSYNEPPEMAVTEAIEKGVQSLIIEGIQEGLWELQNPGDMNSEAIQTYNKEKEESEKLNYAGIIEEPRPKLGFGANMGGEKYAGDYPNSVVKLGGELYAKYDAMDALSFSLHLGRTQLENEKYFSSVANYVELQAAFNLLPRVSPSPYLIGGAGLLLKDKGFLDIEGKASPFLTWGAGIEYMAAPNLGISFTATNRYSLNDDIDRLKRGNINDFFWSGRVGITYYMQ
ncbi:MAG TPA: CsgG/HfaB family protein [Ignavibacteriales bacterium]|nr:CsgG/HfaB family protein [Ignavibacteriales bacterium]